MSNTLSFRVETDLFDEIRLAAKRLGLTSSDYVREAVREKNARNMSERIATLSRQLSAQHLEFNDSIAGANADGLD